MAEGLSRHDALHAIGSVLAEHMFASMQVKGAKHPTQAEHNAAVECLTAKAWRRKYGQ